MVLLLLAACAPTTEVTSATERASEPVPGSTPELPMTSTGEVFVTIRDVDQGQCEALRADVRFSSCTWARRLPRADHPNPVECWCTVAGPAQIRE